MGEPVQVRAEPTPNPETVKFTVNRVVVSGRSETYTSPAQTFLSPLARSLFDVPGVAGVFFLKDFVTIRRAPGEDWNAIVPRVSEIIVQHFAGRE